MSIKITTAIEGTPERIENENGVAIRFRDGTMICTKRIEYPSIPITTAFGSDFMSEAMWLGTEYAAEFTELYNEQVTVITKSDAGAWYQVAHNAATGELMFSLVRATSKTVTNVKAEVMAIGRWK